MPMIVKGTRDRCEYKILMANKTYYSTTDALPSPTACSTTKDKPSLLTSL